MSDVTLQEIQDAACVGQGYGELAPENGYYVDGAYEYGPVKYKDPRVNVVTMTIRYMLLMNYNPLEDPADMAVIGNAVVRALDYFKEHHE